MRQVREPTLRVYCYVIIYLFDESRKKQKQSEAAGAQTRSQRHKLTGQVVTPLWQPSFRLQAHKPDGGAITGEALPLNDTVAVERQAKNECYTRAGAIRRRFGHSIVFLLVLRSCFVFLAECLLASLVLQNGESSTAVLYGNPDSILGLDIMLQTCSGAVDGSYCEVAVFATRASFIM